MQSSLNSWKTIDWERLWAPYDQVTYDQVLEEITADDIVLEIGAGDLRLACQIAKKAKKVYAIELQEKIVEQGLKANRSFLPKNMNIVIGDALEWSFPKDITIGILLMRHCSHFQYYAENLKNNGASTLITNARWRVGVEKVSLQEPRIGYQEFELGWFACWCGFTGFKEGPVEEIVFPTNELIHEVSHCLMCHK